MEDFYKDITKEQVISSLEHYQRSDVKLSNENYHLKEDKKELIKWIEKEIYDAEAGENENIDSDISLVYVGQKLAYEKVLRKFRE